MMPNRSPDPGDGSKSNAKRNLPSWMSSKGGENRSHSKRQNNSSEEVTVQDDQEIDASSHWTNQKNVPFSKLMNGVVFVLSGFVNPERSTLRSQSLEMGAEYQQDWSSGCTLLICAFPNTPKFRQVEMDGGTIVSKEWISKCYAEKKLVEIDPYLMHAGRPWRKNSQNHEGQKDLGMAEAEPPKKQDEKRAANKQYESSVSRVGSSKIVKNQFSPTNVEEWAVDDLNKTISWLESQEEKPAPDEVEAIAQQGIITCLQDAIDAIRQEQDIRNMIEQWMFVPRVVKELVELESLSKKGTKSREELCELAVTCKKIYVRKYHSNNGSPKEAKKQKTESDMEVGETKQKDAGYDSDQTIEMTEEEIELACRELLGK